MLGIGVDAVLGGHPLADLLPQAQIAVGGAVLHGGPALLFHHRVQSRFHILHREEFRGGQTAGEGDDLRAGRNLQQLTDVGSLNAAHSVCKINHVPFLLSIW